MNGRCKDCKHWGNAPNPCWDDREVRRCPELEQAIRSDSGGFGEATLATPPEFGCVLFEPKAGA